MFAISTKTAPNTLVSAGMNPGGHATEPHIGATNHHEFIRFMLVLWLAALLALLLASVASGNPPVEPLGVNGNLIDVPARIMIPGPGELPNRVFLVESVAEGMPASKLNLQRGDMIVAIDSMRFTTMAGFRHALWCSSDRPSFLVWRDRAGKLTIHNVPYPHRQPDPEYNRPQPPDSYLMSIDIR